VVKADNADNLNLGSSWVGGVPPTSSDVAVWDSTVTAANTVALGANTNWAGIAIANPGGLVTVSAGNTLSLGASGVDLSQATYGLTLACPSVLLASQTWSVSNELTLTASGAISGTGALTKTGNGVLWLGTANTYSGGTINNGGALRANAGGVFGSGGVTNLDGSTLRMNTSTTLNSVMNFLGTVTIDLNNFGGNQGLNGAWSGSGTVNFINQDSSASRVFTMGGGGTGGGNMSQFTGSVSLGTNTGVFRFNDGGSSQNTGNSSASFDLGTGTATFYTRNRNAAVHMGALFGGPNTRITHGSSSSGISVYSIGGKNVPCLFEGTISDGATASTGVAITKVGTSILTLTGTNRNIGTTTINAGVLQIGNGGIVGQLGSGAIVNNATLVYNRSDNINVPNPISGSGNLVQFGSAILTFDGTNTSSGSLVISNGTVAVGLSGSILCPISLAASSAVFDVSANTAYLLASPLSGNGSVNGILTAGSGANIRPGGNGAAATMTFNTGLSLAGGVILNMDLSDDPSGTTKANDRIAITGDLTLANANSIVIGKLDPTLPAGTYRLITYTGNLIGDLSSLSTGNPYYTLQNPAGAIDLVVASTRPATNLTWVGNASLNDWDSVTANWLNGSLADIFLSGDSSFFTDVGSANPIVNVPGVVTPARTIVNSTANYQFTGIGNIAGTSSLIKSNAGTLTVQTTNDYSGPTLVYGGALEAYCVANGSAPSSLGAANSSPTNFVLNGTTFRFLGSSSATDRGITFDGAAATIDLPTTDVTLALNGSLVSTGALVKTGPGTLRIDIANTYTGGTVLSNGVLALGSDDANSLEANSGVGPTNSPVTFHGGTLHLYGFNGSTTPNYRTFFNPLVVPAGQTGTLGLWPRGPGNSGANSGLRSSLTGAGTLNLIVNYVRDNIDGDWSAFTGRINVMPKNASGDEFRINNNYGYASATIYLNDNVLMDRVTTANSTVNIGELGGSSLAVIGQGNLSAAASTWSVGWLNTTSTFAGTLANDVSLTKVGTGTLNLSGASTHTGSTIVSNGVLALIPGTGGDGSIAASTLISIAAGAYLDVTALGNPLLILNGTQMLQGTGTLRGSADCSGAGTIAPGMPTGTLTVNTAVNLAGGVALMRLNRDATPNCGKLYSPNITLGGTLMVTNAGGRLQVGDTFDLFDGTLSGSFSSIVLPGYYTWDTSQVEVNGTIRVTGVAAGPSISSVDYSTLPGGIITFNATNGAPNGAVSVLTSTDVGLPLTGWTNVASGTFDFEGNLTGLPVTVDPTEARRFYLLQAF
jgi:autotransporter-associated beta strand protein